MNMIYELILVLCLSQSECITIKQQLSGGNEDSARAACLAKLEESLDKFGLDPNEPPYLERYSCTKIYEGDNVRWE